MNKSQKGSAGGKATAIIFRQNAIDKYYTNPQICKRCHAIIEIGAQRVCEVRKKVFCNRTCAALFNNAVKALTYQKVPDTNKCQCGNDKLKKHRKCEKCKIRISPVKNRTYKDLRTKSANWWTARAPIAKDARKTYERSGRPKVCYHCGYDKFFDVCHIKPVSEFTDTALVSEINHIDNLVALCPNHHKEFDKKLLILDIQR